MILESWQGSHPTKVQTLHWRQWLPSFEVVQEYFLHWRSEGFYCKWQIQPELLKHLVPLLKTKSFGKHSCRKFFTLLLFHLTQTFRFYLNILDKRLCPHICIGSFSESISVQIYEVESELERINQLWGTLTDFQSKHCVTDTQCFYF